MPWYPSLLVKTIIKKQLNTIPNLGLLTPFSGID
jgi:hypothetical protein